MVFNNIDINIDTEKFSSLKYLITNLIENKKIFDTISYAKGSSVIKMLMHYIGIDNFRKDEETYW